MTTLNRNNSNWSFEERRKINENWEILESLANSTSNGNNGLKQEVEELKDSVRLNTNNISNNTQRSSQALVQAQQALIDSSSAINSASNALNEALQARQTSDAISDRVTNAETGANNALTISNQANERSRILESQLNNIVADGDSSAEVLQARVNTENVNYPTLGERLNAQEINTDNRFLDNARKTVRPYDSDVSGLENLNVFKSATSLLKPNFSPITVNVNVIGDSITEGNAAGGNSSFYFSNGWLGLLRNKINGIYGNVGRGFIPVFATTGSSFWSLSNFTLATGFFGVAGVTAESSTNGATLTHTFTGTGIGIVYPTRADGGKLEVLVDNTLVRTIDVNTPTQNLAQLTEITGLSNGTHTLVIRAVITGSQRVWVAGAYEITNVRGLRLNMMARSGSIASQHAREFAIPTEVDVLSPKLTIIALTANDFGQQTALETYRQNLQTLVDRAKLFGDVMFVSTGLQANASGQPIQQIEYWKIQRDIAISNNCAFVDVYSAWLQDGDFIKSVDFLRDNVHPTDAGHQDIAERVFRAINSVLNNQRNIILTDKKPLVSGRQSNAISEKVVRSIVDSGVNKFDLIKYDFSLIPAQNSAVLTGTLSVNYNGRNSGGVNALNGTIFDFYLDSSNNVNIVKRFENSPVLATTSISLNVAKKTDENTIELVITPNRNAVTGSFSFVFDYALSYTSAPISLEFIN